MTDAPSHGAPIAVKLFVGHWCAMAREDPQFRIRLPRALKERVEREAEGNNRSLNAEIVMCLKKAFPDYDASETFIVPLLQKELDFLLQRDEALEDAIEHSERVIETLASMKANVVDIEYAKSAKENLQKEQRHINDRSIILEKQIEQLLDRDP